MEVQKIMEGKGRRKSFVVSCGLILSMTASFFSGCANDNMGNKENAESQQTSSKKEILWQEQKFAEVSDIINGNPVCISGYQENLIREPEYTYDYGSRIYSGVSNDKLCFVNLYYGQEMKKPRYYLDTYDLNTKERRQTEIAFDNPELSDFVPWHCEIIGEENMVFFDSKYNQDNNEVTNYYAVYMNAQGEWVSTLDIYPALTEFGIKLEPQFRFENIVCDEEGYLYVCDPKLPRVGIIDETGALTDVMELAGAYDNGAACSMKSPEGIPIFEASTMKEGKNTLFWYDTEKKAMQVLADTKYDPVYEYSRSFNQFGEIYYIRNHKIVCWNTAEGTQERIFDCISNGLSENSFLLRCVTNGAGELFLLDFSGDTACLYEFTDNPVEKDCNIRIADITVWDNDVISASAAAFSRKNPTCCIEYESVDVTADWSEFEAYHDRVLAELVSGKGPDILIVGGDDMKLLNEKGALADISGVLPKETEEQIFKGVLEAGTIDGKLVGLANSMNMWTLFASKNVWTKDTWTLEEFVDLVEKKEGELECVLEGNYYLKTSDSIMKYLALMDLYNSPFLDVEKGECHFDSGLFKKVLEIAKRYGAANIPSGNIDSDAYEEMKESLDGGHALAFVEASISNLNVFSNRMAFLGEDYYCVGFPTNGKSGNYLYCDSFLVVNKEAADMDMVYKYIQYLFDEENQRKAGVDTVRRDILNSFVIYRDWDSGSPWAFSLGDGAYIILEYKPDGTSYLEDYLEYIDSCVPAPTGTQEIKAIISEETEAYFAGEKDLDRTVDVIQRRVQLYLNENK